MKVLFASDFSRDLSEIISFVVVKNLYLTEFYFLSVRNIILVRADISRLPFVSSSIDAVHAGAALHCWPSPSAAVSISFTFS